MLQTEDEIARDIVMNKLEKEDANYIRDMPFTDLGFLHHGFGTWIRNTYELWQRPTWKPVLIDGVDHAEDHPDAISFRVIQKVHDMLNGKLVIDVIIDL